MILVDSSVWITAWRGTSEDVSAELARLIEIESARINPLIYIELLQGARDAAHQRTLRSLLSAVPVLALTPEIWEEIPILSLRWRSKGIQLATVDSTIAGHAHSTGMRLWSLDKVFSKIPNLSLHTL